MPFALSPGLLVGGHYRLERMIGQGGMSCVWAATNMATAKPVALKLLKRRTAGASVRRRRFLQEARVTIDHPNVVKIYDCLDLTDETPLLVMELLRGRTLADELRRAGKLSLPEAAAILRPVVSAVGCAHAHGIIHRDLKPENIFLASAPDGTATVKVLDFGVAKLIMDEEKRGEVTKLTDAGAVIGTVGYMAPEQACGDNIDGRADTWALGVLLYECLAGQKPFPFSSWIEYLTACLHDEVEDIRGRAPETPLAVVDMLDRMLSLDRSRRPELRFVFDTLGAYTDTPSLWFEAPLSTFAMGDEPPVDTVPDPDRPWFSRSSEPPLSTLTAGDEPLVDTDPNPDSPWFSRSSEPPLSTLTAG